MDLNSPKVGPVDFKSDLKESEIVYFIIKAIMSIFLESFKSNLKSTGPALGEFRSKE